MRFRSSSETVDPSADPVLRRFRKAIDAEYGDRIECVVLFGSQARSDHRPDSDYDVAVFLKDWRSLWEELGGMSQAALDILLDKGLVISAKTFNAPWSSG